MNTIKTKSQIPGYFTVCMVIFFVFFAIPLSAENTPDPLTGKKAEQISGKKAIGKGLLKLSKLMMEPGYEKDARGKFKEINGKYVFKVTRNVVVLNFFSTTCIPCMREIPTYNKLAEKFRRETVKMIYVNVDADVNPLDMSRFVAKKRIKVPMMMPNQRDAVRKYKAYSLPRMIVIDKNGIIVKVITGFNENLETELTQLINKLLI